MSQDYKLGGFIRTDKAFTVPTVVAVDGDTIIVHNDNFRQATEREEFIIFFKYRDLLYYPYAMDFRYIENNILFLLIEYNVNTFSHLSKILNSSYEKEEGFDVNIKALVYNTPELPKFSHPLPRFRIEDTYLTEIY